ncbi:hypothetical protein N8303_08160 [Gammaproteobacteria bacterium]|jgi:hypothetical protein|nr:hypothetical protein [Gammaproteobacteria bacterium]
MLMEAKSTANGSVVLDTIEPAGNYNMDAVDSQGLTFQAGVDINLNESLMF